MHGCSVYRRERNGCAGPSGLCARLGGTLCLNETLLDEELFEFAVLVHLEGDVAAADELATDVQLRDRRPRAKGAAD